MDNGEKSEVCVPSGMEDATTEVAKTNLGPVIGAVVVIGVLVLGGWYFWQTGTAQPNVDMEALAGEDMTMGDGTDPVAESLMMQSTSTDISDIEADFNATNTSEFSFDVDEFDQAPVPNQLAQ